MPKDLLEALLGTTAGGRTCDRCIHHASLGPGFVYKHHREGSNIRLCVFLGENTVASTFQLPKAEKVLARPTAHSPMCLSESWRAVEHSNTRQRWEIRSSKEMTAADLIRAVEERGTEERPLVPSEAVKIWCEDQQVRVLYRRQGEGRNYEAWWDADEDSARDGHQLLKFKRGEDPEDGNVWALRLHGRRARELARDRGWVEVPWSPNERGRRAGSLGKWRWDLAREPDAALGDVPFIV